MKERLSWEVREDITKSKPVMRTHFVTGSQISFRHKRIQLYAFLFWISSGCEAHGAFLGDFVCCIISIFCMNGEYLFPPTHAVSRRYIFPKIEGEVHWQ